MAAEIIHTYKHSTLHDTAVKAALVAMVAARILTPPPGEGGQPLTHRKFAYKVDFFRH